MASFRFRLHAVLRQRELVEQDCQRALGAARGKLAEFERELRAMDQTVQAATKDLRDHRLIGRIDLNFLAAHRRFTLAMQRKAIEVAQRMALAQRKVEECQAALAEAAKQRKIIEKLREKQHAQWLANLQRKEMAELDEVGMKISHASLADSEMEAMP